MWKYVLNKMIKQKEAIFFIVMIILSFAVSSAAPYLNGKFIDLLTVSKDIHLIVQFALIIVGVGVVGALLSYCSNLTTVKVLTKTTMASIYEGMDNLLETDLVIAEKLDFSYIAQRLFQDANVITSFVLSNFLSIFLNGILIVGVLYCFFVIDPLLCLIVVVVLIPYIVLFLALKRPLFDSSEKKKEADSRLFGSIHSIVEQVFSIQLNSRFSEAKKEAQASFTNCFPFILKAGRLSYLFSSIDSIIQTVSCFLLSSKLIQLTQSQPRTDQKSSSILYFSRRCSSIHKLGATTPKQNEGDVFPMDGDFFDALSNPYRRQIVRMLKWGNYSVNEITKALEISQPSVSRHLDVLKKANIVVAERRANQIIYSLNLSVMQEFVGKMVEFLDDMKDLKEVRKYESNKDAYNN